MFE
jgi:hypothetical protein